MITKQNRSKKGFQIALLFISSLSIGLNLFLYSQLRKYYTLLYAVELDPLGLSVFQGAEEPKPTDGLQTLVFYGDSRAAQWTTPPLEGFTFLNRAIGNQTTAQVLLRFDEHVAPLRPDIIVLQVGVNDLKTIPLFPGRRESIVSECMENIQQIVDRSLDLNATVVLSTIFPTGTVPWQRRLVWSDDIEQSIIEVNTYLQSLAADKVIIFDAAKLLSDSNGRMKKEYSYDELHLNQAGYDALNREFIRLLETLQKESSSRIPMQGPSGKQVRQ